MNNRVRNQGGWVVNFVVVGAVLVLGLLAGLYYLKSQEASRDTSNLATETDQSDQTSKDTDKPDTEAPRADDDKGDSNTSTDRDDDFNTPSTDDTVGSDDATDTKPSHESDDSAELPQTGPADAAAQLTGATLLTIAAAAYVQSRRSL
jgi:hypothetical protein